MILPSLPPKAASWSVVSSIAASISYADRGTSAIVASSLLDQLHWTETQLGSVQSAFFVGYALTQVFGGVLGGQKSSVESRVGYRTILPVSLFFTGLTTLFFPLAAIHFGPLGASINRLALGLFEGMLLPAAMAGVSDTISVYYESSEADEDYKATASSFVIAGCYLGSGWAYLSAYALFSENFQTMLIENGFTFDIWPLVFYVNGILAFLFLWVYRGEFDILQGHNVSSEIETKSDSTHASVMYKKTVSAMWNDTISISKQCLKSKSARAILAAQIGQGALLYSIASWGPLYLERIGTDSNSLLETDTNSLPTESLISQTAVTAGKAAYSLIPSQIGQAFVGISIGATADKLSNKIGTTFTRRSLQLLSGIVPALILLYLLVYGADHSTSTHVHTPVSFRSPAFLFGSAQTISALSLGAVSVSHLDIAVPSASGAVYALGNVMAAVAGSAMVNLFGFLLEQADTAGVSGEGREFTLPFEVVAALSSMGSLIYGLTIETNLEIGVDSNSTMIK